MSVYYFNITYRCNSNCIFCAANHPLYKDEREMDANEFDETLQQQNVGSRDRVIINGGEPTVHREFWDILDAVHKRGAKIDLFTNGIKLKNKDFAAHVLQYTPIHIRIPLFGSTSSIHDRLTGVPGNFDATITGIDNLCSGISNGVTLEIKLLLSKATVQENYKIYQMIKKRWGTFPIRITLNPLLISDCVIQQRDIMIDTYDSMMKESEALIRTAITDNTDFSVGLIPFCSFPNEELLNLCRGTIAVSSKLFYASPGFTKNIDKLDYRKPCLTCKYVTECDGFPKNYIDYFGTDVIKPIK